LQGPANQEYDVYVETHLNDSHIPYWSQSHLDDNRNSFPLMTRDWALQERLLSSRLVHFTRGEVMWECLEFSTCQCSSAYYLGDPAGKSPFVDPQKVKYRNLADRNTADGGCDGSYVWDSVVSLYSRLDLTRKADKLPALSSIAKREQKRRHGDQYIAGLWRSTLVYDLMWRPSYSSTT